MAVIAPFCGYRYNSKKISDMAAVTAPQDDRISEDFYNRLKSSSEYNISRIGFSEIEGSPLTDARFKENSRLFSEWIQNDILKRDEKPAIYIYEQKFTMKSNLQSLKGIISLVKLENYDKKVVLPHQKTSKKGREHQYKLIKELQANISPVFSLYNDSDISISSLIVASSTAKPDISFVTADGITENIWIIDAPEIIAQFKTRFEDKQLFIADGHHKYETCLKYRDDMHIQNPDVKDAPYDYTMMALMPMYSSGLFLLPTHRLVKGIEDFDENIIINMLTEDFKISRIYFTSNDYDKVIIDRITDVLNEKYVGLYTGKDYYYLLKPYAQGSLRIPHSQSKSEDDGDCFDLLSSLETNLLNTTILEKYFGLSKEQLENPHYMTYTMSAKEAIHRVQIGSFQCAFFLNSTKIDEMCKVAEAGEVMPLKSTFFFPKTITGLVMYKF